jgi:hypothetical protein
MVASRDGDVEVVRLLLSHNEIDINIQDHVRNNYFVIVIKLLMVILFLSSFRLVIHL